MQIVEGKKVTGLGPRETGLSQMVAIGIATRNRWEDLRNTLQKIADFGLFEVRTLIIDDGSDVPCPFDVSSLLKNAEIQRFAESEGYIVRRNQLAREMSAKYYLSLDDDSFPVGGSLYSAVEFAESCDDLLCLSFPVYNPVTDEHQVVSLQDKPYRVRSFIGCGHLLNRERFLDLGGYRDELVHQGEEGDISARAFQDGLYCYHFPDLKIHHTASNTGRDKNRVDFYGARNSALWNDWFMPSDLKLVKQSRTFLSRVVGVLQTGRMGQLLGQVEGLKQISRLKAYRREMSINLYREWTKLPHN